MRCANRILVALLTAVGLASCAIREPIVEGPTVIIFDSVTDRTESTAHVFELTAIDGVSVKATTGSKTQGANSGNGMALVVINPNYHYAKRKPLKLSVTGYKYFAAPIMDMFGKSMRVKGELTVDPAEIPELHIVGTLSATESSIWIADKDGNVLSDKITTVH